MTNSPDRPVANLVETDQIDERGLCRAVHALRDRRYRWWFACQIFSSSGSMTQAVAQSWLVFRLTGHPVDLGLLGIVTWAPVLFGAAWGGVLADRLDRRHLMMATQSLFVVVNVVQAGLVASGRIQLWMIFTLGALNGAVNAVDSPARQVYVFQLVGRQRLASAVGLFEVVINAARVLGPAVGGILLAVVGTAPCFAFNAASYLPMLWMLWFFKPDPQAGKRPAPARGRPGSGLREGLRLVRRHPEIRLCVLIALPGAMLFDLSVSAPPFASRALHLGDGQPTGRLLAGRAGPGGGRPGHPGPAGRATRCSEPGRGFACLVRYIFDQHGRCQDAGPDEERTWNLTGADPACCASAPIRTTARSSPAGWPRCGPGPAARRVSSP